MSIDRTNLMKDQTRYGVRRLMNKESGTDTRRNGQRLAVVS